MESYEKLGVFYLGRYHDLEGRKTLPDLLLYNSNDLLTHALCVGMTGSGKTGLCFDIIEEAAIDGIPAILIDPKGDLSNLLLTFPELRPSDFEPWVNPDEARKKGVSPAEFAAQQAELWKKGLLSWEQNGERIGRLREAAEFTIYTPGSNAGIPVSILNSFAAPPQEMLDDSELLRERINTTVSGLLGLVGVEADPTKGREAIFLANVIQHAWEKGHDLELGSLIQEIQSPGVQRIGVMDVESFYPAKERFALATAINGLLASPGFGAWLEGEPLDIQRIYYTETGKPRVAIFSIAHLNDAERMFFVTLLLNQLLGWMRTQSGTTSLRALLYMDEIFGYFPPVANPPSKRPLLTLLKQGRAFGLGAILATQNPVDLDYKGLANIGTWFLGRLQTDRDKQRVLDGLEGAAQGTTFDRAAMERTLAGLGNRVFLLHNVHEEGASIFESRWAMSYLRGPMTRNQIKTLMDARRAPVAGGSARRSSGAPAGARVGVGSPTGSARVGEGVVAREPGLEAEAPRSRLAGKSTRPTLPPAIPQYFVPAGAEGEAIVYEPMLLGAASVRFADSKMKVDMTEEVALLAPIKDDAVPVDWAESQEAEVDPNDLERNPAPGAAFAELPPAASQAKNYALWQKEFVNAIYSSRKLTLFKSMVCDQISRIDESEGDFRARLNQAARERRDAAVAKLRAKYAPKLAMLNERARRAEQAVQREAEQARSAKLSTALSFGSTLLGAFLGRKRSVPRTSAKPRRRCEALAVHWSNRRTLRAQGKLWKRSKNRSLTWTRNFKRRRRRIESGGDPATESLETVELRPTKTNVRVKLVALAWTRQVQSA
jgi:hypothetical protein